MIWGKKKRKCLLVSSLFCFECERSSGNMTTLLFVAWPLVWKQNPGKLEKLQAALPGTESEQKTNFPSRSSSSHASQSMLTWSDAGNRQYMECACIQLEMFHADIWHYLPYHGRISRYFLAELTNNRRW